METSNSRSARGSYGSECGYLGSNEVETDLDMIETVQGGIESVQDVVETFQDLLEKVMSLSRSIEVIAR